MPALIVTVLQNALVLVLGFTALLVAVDRVQRAATTDDQSTILAGVIGGGILVGLLILAISVFGGALLQGVLVVVVARGALGERPGPIAALRIAGRRILPLAAVAAMLTVLQILAFGVLALLIIGLVALGTIGIVFAVIVGILGFLGFLVGYGFLAVKLATVPSTIVLERLGVFPSIARSWVLMRQAFWRTFGLLALVVVIVGAASYFVQIPFQVLGVALTGVLAPNGGTSSASDPSTAILVLLVSTVPSLIATTIVGGIGQIAQTAAVVLVYLDRRMRREGLDFDLQRFTEDGGTDPYLRAADRTG